MWWKGIESNILQGRIDNSSPMLWGLEMSACVQDVGHYVDARACGEIPFFENDFLHVDIPHT